MNNKLVVLEPDEIIESGLSGFNEKDLPVMIQGQISKLNDLDKSVKKAMEAAALAKDSAKSAKNKSAGLFKKKAAIEELQSAGIDLAEAVQSGAEAQRISFEFQTKLAKIAKYLFGLGVSNIASNRFVVRELEMKLKGASQEELSELARQELILVVKQLKEQEDILRKQEDFSKALKNYNEILKAQTQKSQQIDGQLQMQADINKVHNEQLKIHAETSKRIEEELKAQAETDKKLEEKLRSQAEIDKLQNEQLRIHAETGKQLEKQLETLAELASLHHEKLHAQAGIVKIQEEQLVTQSENVKNHDKQLATLQAKNNDLNEQIMGYLTTIESQAVKINMLEDEMNTLKTLLDSKANKPLSKINLAITLLAFVISVSHFFF
jgi:hypothetical protein